MAKRAANNKIFMLDKRGLTNNVRREEAIVGDGLPLSLINTRATQWEQKMKRITQKSRKRDSWTFGKDI